MWAFYLDGTQYDTEDLRWENITFAVKRFDDFNALFFEFAGGLEFTGTAYDYLAGLIQSNTCDKVHFRVMYRCDDVAGNFEKVHEGYIYLAEADVDLFYCVISCDSEDNSYSERIISLKDVEVPLDSTASENGTTITACPQTTISVIHPTTGIGVSRVGYKVFDVFQFLMRYITNNQSSITSSLFSTAATREQKIITFTNTAQLSTGTGNITINFVNPFNVSYSVTAAIQGSVISTLRFLLYAIHNTLLSDPQQEYYANDWYYANNVETNGTDNLTITWNMPFEITSISGAVATVTDVTDAEFGLENLWLTSGLFMRGQSTGAVPSISFSKLWEELNKIGNLGFNLSNVSGVATMTIEQIETIFGSTTQALEVYDVPMMKKTRSFRFAKDTIKVGDGGKKQGFLSGINRAESWFATAGSCKNTNSQDCKNEWIVDHDRLFFQRTAGTVDTYDDEIFLLETDGSQSVGYTERAYTNTTGGNIDAQIYNVMLCNYWKVKNWLFSSAGNMSNGSKTIINNTVPRIRDEYTFKSPVPIEDFLTFKNNPGNFIKFSPTELPQDGGIGWIEELGFTVKSSETEFKLLAT